MSGRDRPITSEELNRRLQLEGIVPLAASDWNALAECFEELERHAAGMAGALLIVRVSGGLAAVEQSSPDERVIRRLASPEEARRFVEQRLAEYERMWDGCGCRIDYYKY